MKRAILSDTAPQPSGPYSQAVVSRGLVFVAGQGPFLSETREIAGDDVGTQTRQVIRNIERILAAAESSLEHLVSLRVFVRHISDRPLVDEVLRELLPEPYPARTTIEVPLPRFLVEMDVVAEVPDES